MERSYTNRARKWVGDTVSVTVRLPKPVVDYMDSNLGIRIRNRSEFLQHWAWIGKLVSENAELDDALDWALGEAEPSILEVPMTPEPEVRIAKPEYEAIFAPDAFEPPQSLIDAHEAIEEVDRGEVGLIHESQLEALRNRIK